jgi:putative ABC transport system permease protein
VLQDLRFAVRLIAKDPWFTGAAVIVLAVGIGLNTTVFTLVNAVLIRGLPFPASDSLYIVQPQTRSGRHVPMSHDELEEVRRRTRAFAGLAAVRPGDMSISDDQAFAEQVSGAWVTANAFAVLGQTPLVGRDFLAEEAIRGAQPVVILGYRLWKNRYGSDAGVIGRTVRLNGEPVTIIGVMPEGMRFPITGEVWTLFAPGSPPEQRWRGLTAFGRVNAGVSRREAQADLDLAASELYEAEADVADGLTRLSALTFNERFSGGEIRTLHLAMMGAVVFVLLIACANVANLLLSRSAQRAREVSVRLALGATRARIVRQLLTESLLLGLIGGFVGLLLAVAGVRLFDAAETGTARPFWIEFTVDYVVVSYLAAVCTATVVLAGLVPAWQVSQVRINDVMREVGHGSVAGRRTRALAGAVVVTEIALTVVLLAGAGLMLRSVLALSSTDLGFRTDGVMAVRLQLVSRTYSMLDERLAFFDRLVPRLRTIPGLQDVAITTSIPPRGAPGRFFGIEGRPDAPLPELWPEALVVSVSPGFFGVLNLPVRPGRDFTEIDGTPGNETVLINERLATQYFPQQNPIGQRVRLRMQASGASPAAGWRTVVGVVPTLGHGSPRDTDPPAVIYMPYRQEAQPAVLLVARSALETGIVTRAVQGEVHAIDRDQPIVMVQTVEQMLAQARGGYRLFASLFVIFGGVGLVLSAFGLYAVMAYSVMQRTQEIGVRMALGADAGQVSWLVLRRGLAQLGAGLAIGLGSALVLTRVLRALIVQVTPADPATFAGVTILLALVAIAACLIPARHATRIDPLLALRSE